MTPPTRPTPRSARTSPLQRRVKEERRTLYRQVIAEAAERVFAEKGADRSQMREIATEAGISLGTLYGVIDGKESLFQAIHQTRMHEFLDCIREARDAHEGTLESHLAVLKRGAAYFLERPDFLRMCCRDGYGWASGLPASAWAGEIWSESVAIPRDLFARGIAEKIYVDEDPDLMVRKMLALKQVELAYWLENEFDPRNEIVSSQLESRLESQFIRAFCVHNS
ncbi:MAG: TetR/AcrR family transcriptional regulator [Deltaproteobacteria bacterium]|nr:TetR/AcrR family transcriptional regulator [Deltaproteobacteria bacterium]